MKAVSLQGKGNAIRAPKVPQECLDEVAGVGGGRAMGVSFPLDFIFSLLE